MTPTNASIAAAVRAELARTGMTGRALARELGWSYGYTERRLKLNNPRPFRTDELTKIAEHLGIPMMTFLEKAS